MEPSAAETAEQVEGLRAGLARIATVGSRIAQTLEGLGKEHPTSPENDAILKWLAQETRAAWEAAYLIEGNSRYEDPEGDWARELRLQLAAVNAAALLGMSFVPAADGHLRIPDQPAYTDAAGTLAESLAKDFGAGPSPATD
jgi:hypothetical protein